MPDPLPVTEQDQPIKSTSGQRLRDPCTLPAAHGCESIHLQFLYLDCDKTKPTIQTTVVLILKHLLFLFATFPFSKGHPLRIKSSKAKQNNNLLHFIMRCLDTHLPSHCQTFFQLTAISKIYLRSGHKQCFVSVFVVRSLYVKITDVFHFQIDGTETYFPQKFPLAWKQPMLAVLAEQTVNWKIHQMLHERE